MLNVLQDPDARDTVLVCHLSIYGFMSNDQIAEVLRSRDSCRYGSFESAYIDTILSVLRRPSKDRKELFGGVYRMKMLEELREWNLTGPQYKREGPLDVRFDELIRVWYIWKKAKTDLEKSFKEKEGQTSSPPRHSSSDSPSARFESNSDSGSVSQHATGGQTRDGAEQRTEDLWLLTGLFRKSTIPLTYLPHFLEPRALCSPQRSLRSPIHV